VRPQGAALSLLLLAACSQSPNAPDAKPSAVVTPEVAPTPDKPKTLVPADFATLKLGARLTGADSVGQFVSDGETRARRPGDNDVIAPRLERARTRAGREARRGDTVRNATRRSAEFYVADRPHVASATGHHTQAVNEVASLERELHRARRRCWLDPHEVGYVGLTRSARQHHHERTPTYATHNNVPRSMRNATVK